MGIRVAPLLDRIVRISSAVLVSADSSSSPISTIPAKTIVAVSPSLFCALILVRSQLAKCSSVGLTRTFHV